MRIHTTAQRADILDAIAAANRAIGYVNAAAHGDVHEYRARTAKKRASITPIHNVELTEHRSQTHPRAFEVKFSGDSTRGPNSGQYGMDNYGKAATWDQWGLFLSALYEVDTAARVGGAKLPIYADAEHFHWTTANRYRGAQDNDGTRRVDASTGTFMTAGLGYHRQHKWQSVGKLAVCDAWVSQCACGATLRRADYGTYCAYIAPLECRCGYLAIDALDLVEHMHMNPSHAEIGA